MADHPNAVLVRRAYEPFASGDLDTLRSVMAEDVKWHEPGTSLIAGDYIGRERVMELFGKLVDLSGGTFKGDAVDILANDDRAVVIQRSTATRKGKSLDTQDVIVAEIRNGKLASVQGFPADQRQEDGFWS